MRVPAPKRSGAPEGHIHGLRLAPVEGDAGEPDQPLVWDPDPTRPGFEFGHLLAETSPRFFDSDSDCDRVTRSGPTVI